MRLTSIALILVAVGACSRPAAAPPSPSRLIIATYNVDMGIAPDGKAIEAILATGADVLCL